MLERDRQISQLEQTVSFLRVENQKRQNEALKAQQHVTEIQQNFSKVRLIKILIAFRIISSTNIK